MIDLTTEFHLVTSILAILGTVLLIWHMTIAWPYIVRTGQRMLYITVMWFAMTIAYAAAYDITVGRLIEVSAVLATVGCILLIITMAGSIRKTKRIL